jgi:hypothetical protein
MAMDLDVVGAHILLMCSAGASSHGYRLPNDERFLRSQIKFPSDADWARIKLQLLMGAWKISRDRKWWIQAGLERSINKFNKFIENQKQKGKKGAATRWLKPHDSRGHKSAVAGPMAADSLSSSSSSAKLNTTPSISPPGNRTIQNGRLSSAKGSQEVGAPQALSSQESEKPKQPDPQPYEPGDSPRRTERGFTHGSRKRNSQASGAVHASDPHKYDGLG